MTGDHRVEAAWGGLRGGAWQGQRWGLTGGGLQGQGQGLASCSAPGMRGPHRKQVTSPSTSV